MQTKYEEAKQCIVSHCGPLIRQCTVFQFNLIVKVMPLSKMQKSVRQWFVLLLRAMHFKTAQQSFIKTPVHLLKVSGHIILVVGPKNKMTHVQLFLQPCTDIGHRDSKMLDPTKTSDF